MKTDSTSGLCIKQIVTVAISTILITIITAQVFMNNQNLQTASIDEIKIEEVQEEVQVAQTEERDSTVTSRESEERIVEEQTIQNNYISIDEIEISRDIDLTQRCGVSKEDFQILMDGTSEFFSENSGTIYDLCEQYEINEIFFCGLIVAESGWNIASNHSSTNNYISMMSGGRLIHYETPEDGLEAAARLLHEDYLSEDGCYYNGATIAGVKTRFCPNSTTWVGLVYGCMSQIV